MVNKTIFCIAKKYKSVKLAPLTKQNQETSSTANAQACKYSLSSSLQMSCKLIGNRFKKGLHAIKKIFLLKTNPKMAHKTNMHNVYPSVIPRSLVELGSGSQLQLSTETVRRNCTHLHIHTLAPKHVTVFMGESDAMRAAVVC